MWSYQLGLQNGARRPSTVLCPFTNSRPRAGWMPEDPRTALGTCDAVGVQDNDPFNGTYQSWQTGGSGAGTIAATALASFSQYPPPQISNAAGADPTLLPQYTHTSAVPTLPPESFSGVPTASLGDGWADPADTSLAPVQIEGCLYPNAWGAASTQTAFLCGTAAAAAEATMTP